MTASLPLTFIAHTTIHTACHPQPPSSLHSRWSNTIFTSTIHTARPYPPSPFLLTHTTATTPSSTSLAFTTFPLSREPTIAITTESPNSPSLKLTISNPLSLLTHTQHHQTPPISDKP
ncbi:hypothetical protein ACFE04_020333 [Oxalis oulophora]